MKNLFRLMLVIAAITACAKVEDVTTPSIKTIIGYTDNDEVTKTTLQNAKNIVWNTNDIIRAYGERGSYESTKTTINASGSQATFEFTTTVEDKFIYAAYPASAAASAIEKAGDFDWIDISIPTEQAAVKGSFADDTNAAIALVKDGDIAQFKNVGALLNVEVKNDDISAIKISASTQGDGGMTGQGSAAIDNNETVSTICSLENDGVDYVELKGTFEKGSKYYFVVFPGDYENIAIQFTNTSGQTATFNSSATLNLSRNANVKLFDAVIPDSKWVSGETPAPEVLFYESFDTNDGTGGNDGSWSGTIASNNLEFDNTGWECSNGSGAYQCAKFGSGSKKGSATTPEIACNGDIVLTFKAAAWNGSSEKTTLNISTTSGTVSESSVTLVKGTWTEYTITISGVETSTQITFEAVFASNNRFFLDEVKVVAAAPDTRTALSTPANLAVTGKTVSWAAVENAGSYLVTVGTNEAVSVTTNSYVFDGTDDYYNVSIIAVPSDTDAFKNSAAAILEDACFGTPTLPAPVLSQGAVDESSITVNWTKDDKAANGYNCELYQGTDKIGESKTVTDGSVKFENLTDNVTYTVKVNAIAVTGTKAYAASGVSSIDITTIPAKHASDVTSAGQYTIKGLTVLAVNGSNVIVGDSTGYLLLYKSGHGLDAGNTFDLDGTSELYNGVYEFKTFTITNKQTGSSPVHGTPTVYTAEDLVSYKTSPVIDYVSIKGIKQASGYLMNAGSETVNIYGSTSEYYGMDVIVTGYVFGYDNTNGRKYTNLMLVNIEEDLSAPKLSVSGETSKTWAWNNNAPFVLNVTVANGSWSVTPTTLDWATVSANTEDNTLTITPNGNNTSDAKYTGTLTLKHSAREALTVEISVAQEFQPTCAKPEITFSSGKVSISAESGAAIKYTTDGTNPGESATATIYSAPFEISSAVTVKAIATKADCKNSQVAELYCNPAHEPAWTKVTDALSLKAGDIVTLVYESSNMEISGISTTSTTYGIGTEYHTTPTGLYTFKLVEGSSDGSFAFKHDNVYLNWTSGNSLGTHGTLSGNTSWTITISGGEATITNVKDNTRKLQWNPGSPRFACYTSTQKLIQLYRYE